jgi:hypothetical protein
MSRIRPSSSHRPRMPLARMLTLAALGPAAGASAQISFSIDWQSPPVGAPDACFGVPITEGDILVVPPGPFPPPCIAISGGMGPPAPGLSMAPYPGAIGHPPGVRGFVELDALSYGRDRVAMSPSTTSNGFYDWYFSVDEFATGIPGTPLAPAVWTQGALGAAEASADIYVDVGVGFFVPCGAPIMGNTGFMDGNGIAPFGAPGLGLIEPNPPTPGVRADPGSNLDALDVDTPVGPGIIIPVYFSLDSAFLDPLEGFPNSGSAVAQGFVGGDVLVTPAPGVGPFLWAPAAALGLDLFGPDTDDLDALVLFENGSGAFERPTAPFSWAGGATDAIFFSLRRGSALIMAGVPDSRCGVPIEEGDILMPPLPGSVVPAIWIRAEVLGLATVRSGTAIVPFGDDLDALDVICNIPADLNGDGVVNLGDLTILLGSFGIGAGGDVDGDGDTDLGDLTILLGSFGATC